MSEFKLLICGFKANQLSGIIWFVINFPLLNRNVILSRISHYELFHFTFVHIYCELEA